MPPSDAPRDAPSGASPRGVAAGLRELGVSGTQHFSGYIGYSSEEVRFRGRQGARTFNLMRHSDGTIGGIMHAFEQSIRNIEWRVEKYNSGGEDGPTEDDQAAAEFLTQCMHDMSVPWTDFISEILTMFHIGWSWFEVVFKMRKGPQATPDSRYDDGRIGIRSLAPRSQLTLDHWQFRRNGDVRGWWQRNPNDATELTYLPKRKALHFRTRSEYNNPEGVSILRTAHRAWRHKVILENYRGITLERGGPGFPTIQAPMNMTTEKAMAQESDEYKFAQLIANIRNGKSPGAIVPYGAELEIHSIGAGSDVLNGFMNAISDCVKEITRATLTQFLEAGMSSGGSSGSFSQQTVQQDFFQMSMEGWAKNIEDTLNRFLVTKLFDMNPDLRDSVDGLPMIRAGTVGVPNLAQISNFFARGVEAGVIVPTYAVTQMVHNIMSAPEPSEEEYEENKERRAGPPGNTPGRPMENPESPDFPSRDEGDPESGREREPSQGR